jgi:hypothetical protein
MRKWQIHRSDEIRKREQMYYVELIIHMLLSGDVSNRQPHFNTLKRHCNTSTPLIEAMSKSLNLLLHTYRETRFSAYASGLQEISCQHSHRRES